MTAMRGLLIVALLAGVGCGDPLVGGECREGFRPVDGRCVSDSDLDSGVADAGARDGSALPDGDRPDAALPDGALPDGTTAPDSALPDAGVPPDGSNMGGDSGPRDAGGPPRCDLGELLCDDACVRPGSDPRHCGGCGIMCDPGQVCIGGRCEMVCSPPAVMCGSLCLDVTTTNDPDNCGGCGVRCASGICVSGSCVDESPGHVVLIGHDYRVSRVGMNRIAGNSVFLAPGAPVDVLTFEGDAVAASIQGVNQAIDQVATERGRSWVGSSVVISEFLVQLDDADVFLMYPQVATPDGTLQALGTMWSVGLDSFLQRGGVVVVFDGPGINAGTWQFLDAAGLLAVSARTDVSDMPVRVVSAGDAVALSVPLTYLGEMNTVRFDSTATNVVVEHPSGPVVIHRVVAP